MSLLPHTSKWSKAIFTVCSWISLFLSNILLYNFDQISVNFAYISSVTSSGISCHINWAFHVIHNFWRPTWKRSCLRISNHEFNVPISDVSTWMAFILHNQESLMFILLLKLLLPFSSWALRISILFLTFEGWPDFAWNSASCYGFMDNWSISLCPEPIIFPQCLSYIP